MGLVLRYTFRKCLFPLIFNTFHLHVIQIERGKNMSSIMMFGFFQRLFAVCHLFCFGESSLVADVCVVPTEGAIFISVFM